MFRSLFLLPVCLLAASLNASEINQTIHQLASEDYALRNEARSDLMQRFAKASQAPVDSSRIEALEQACIQALKQDLPLTERLYLIRILGLYASPSAAESLIPLLQDSDPQIQVRVISTLARIGNDTTDTALLDAFKSAPQEQQSLYFDALAMLEQPEATSLLVQALKAPDPAQAVLAAQSLGKAQIESAVPPLLNARETENAQLQVSIDQALLHFHLDAATAQRLLQSSKSASIRNGAFSQLLKLDAEAAELELQGYLKTPDALGRSLLIRTAMHEGSARLRGNLVQQLAALSVDDQWILLAAIAELELNNYEAELLDLYASAESPLKGALTETLGLVGGDASFEVLYSAFEAAPDDPTIALALSRLQAPAVDQRALQTLANSTDTQARISAINLLQLRNTEGTTALLNRIVLETDDSELKKAVFKGLENIGNFDSVEAFIQLINQKDPLMRPAQQSLKRLSVSFDAPHYLWTEHYLPALQSAQSDTDRIPLILILDGVAGRRTLDYLEASATSAKSSTELSEAAIRTLLRWPNYDSGDFWLSIILSDQASAKNRSNAERSLKRLHTNKDILGDKKDKMELSVRIVQQVNDPELKAMVIGSYENGLHWQERVHIRHIFKPLKSDPDVGERVAALLDF
ncbi:HEAT repeat domain-containing protein [Coraliomargarita akajimensis]|nr:HEAT repeat domain-containing protein [Coraliomargarita akajimensis]